MFVEFSLKLFFLICGDFLFLTIVHHLFDDLYYLYLTCFNHCCLTIVDQVFSYMLVFFFVLVYICFCMLTSLYMLTICSIACYVD
jgi:hypothetical protein